MNFQVLKYLLLKLGFLEKPQTKKTNIQVYNKKTNVVVKAVKELEKIHKQEESINQIWKILGGPHFKHVTLNNLRLLLLGIKGLHVLPNESLPQEDLLKAKFGVFSAAGDLYLEVSDVAKLTAHFKDLIQERLLHE